MINNLNILIVEGNIRKDSEIFIKAAGSTASENLKKLLIKLVPGTNIEIINPGNDIMTSQALNNINKFDGVAFTGGALRINDMTDEIKKHINFAANCFNKNKKILAICWGLQVCSTAAGGKVAKGVNGAHIGIASNVQINQKGKTNLIYKNKKNIFNTPAFNYDEVCEIPKNAEILSSNDVNKVMGLYFKSGKSEIWGFQYHPDYEYYQMINLSNARKERILQNKYFESEEDFQKHLSYIEAENKKLDFHNRTCEIKNWIDIIKN